MIIKQYWSKAKILVCDNPCISSCVFTLKQNCHSDVSIYIYIYIYIQTHTHPYTHAHIYICIYIYREREREREVRERERERERERVINASSYIYILFIAGRRIVWYELFSRILALSKTLKAKSRIWTQYRFPTMVTVAPQGLTSI